jgi:hypothetical protein
MKKPSKNTPATPSTNDAANDEPSLLEQVVVVIESPINETLDLAIFAAETLGIEVLPLKHQGKAPTTKHGCKDSSRDPVQIKTWFEKGNYNLGFATGSKSKVFAVDIDIAHHAIPAKYGDESLAELERIHGKLPDTVEVDTGNGG